MFHISYGAVVCATVALGKTLRVLLHQNGMSMEQVNLRMERESIQACSTNIYTKPIYDTQSTYMHMWVLLFQPYSTILLAQQPNKTCRKVLKKHMVHGRLSLSWPSSLVGMSGELSLVKLSNNLCIHDIGFMKTSGPWLPMRRRGLRLLGSCGRTQSMVKWNIAFP